MVAVSPKGGPSGGAPAARHQDVGSSGALEAEDGGALSVPTLEAAVAQERGGSVAPGDGDSVGASVPRVRRRRRLRCGAISRLCMVG